MSLLLPFVRDVHPMPGLTQRPPRSHGLLLEQCNG
ncbi:hypothetical protein [Streptomyces sp. RO-S4]